MAVLTAARPHGGGLDEGGGAFRYRIALRLSRAASTPQSSRMIAA